MVGLTADVDSTLESDGAACLVAEMEGMIGRC